MPDLLESISSLQLRAELEKMVLWVPPGLAIRIAVVAGLEPSVV